MPERGPLTPGSFRDTWKVYEVRHSGESLEVPGGMETPFVKTWAE